jgi:drug/metabolite transporter (DMT)-like permease
MLVQIAILAWIFLGEELDLLELLGLGLATVGVMIFQMVRTKASDTPEDEFFKETSKPNL